MSNLQVNMNGNKKIGGVSLIYGGQNVTHILMFNKDTKLRCLQFRIVLRNSSTNCF